MEKIKIGTRGSRLALIQAEIAASAFREKGYLPHICVVRTRGDADFSHSLSEIGRGAFTDVFSDRIARGEIDCAVHSAKDLPTGEDKDGFYCLARADARDVLVYKGKGGVRRVGTGSPRRAAAVSKLYPEADILPVRGNVDTRLRKLFSGEFDAVVLAAAGLLRLGFLQEDGLLFEGNAACVRYFSPEECVPAACQGIIAVEGEAGKEIGDAAVLCAALAERRMQRAVGGDCSGGAGAYLCGDILYAQKDGRIECTAYRGDESIRLLAERFV